MQSLVLSYSLVPGMISQQQEIKSHTFQHEPGTGYHLRDAASEHLEVQSRILTCKSKEAKSEQLEMKSQIL